MTDEARPAQTSELVDAYAVVGEMLEYFDTFNLATWAPLASIIERERRAAIASRTPDPRIKALEEELDRFRRPSARDLSTDDPITPLPTFQPQHLLGLALLFREWDRAPLWGRPNQAELAARQVETAFHRIKALEEEVERLQDKVRNLTRLLDEQLGTPCAHIRWQQEREAVEVERDALRKALEAVESELMLDGHLAEIVQEVLAAREPRMTNDTAPTSDLVERPFCTGCGTRKTLDELRSIPGVISCCPERRMVYHQHVVDARIKALEDEVGQLNRVAQLEGVERKSALSLARKHIAKTEAAEAALATAREALECISKNTCCDRCQEAALVARAAIRNLATIQKEPGAPTEHEPSPRDMADAPATDGVLEAVEDQRLRRYGPPRCCTNGWYDSYTGGFRHPLPCPTCNPQGISPDAFALELARDRTWP